MPRPGPRPYECVRRAWHSDRHQPMRGSLIQEIFRVVNEIHSSATKKNKEWQEKLPIVVLKAEEIMYSKANSEAEYMDLKTLWDRTNDAINTIIRRDGSTETGELLQPCIEAALNLGCTPRRASRSQRCNTPRFYLSGCDRETTRVPSSNSEKTTQGNHTINNTFMYNFSNFMRPTTTTSTNFRADSHSPIVQNNGCISDKFPLLSEFPTTGNNHSCSVKLNPSSTSCSIYPLYYGDCDPSKESKLSNSHFMEPGTMQDLFSCEVDALNKIAPVDSQDSPNNLHESECDLSLRLGPLVVPCLRFKNCWPQDVDDAGSSICREGRKMSNTSTQLDKEVSFFVKSNADGPFDSFVSKLSSTSENLNVDAALKKQKAAFIHSSDSRRFCWQPKLPSNQFS